ncbi:MAG: CoA transferase [Pseudomonadales bacterium]|jgi:crotonobetainyl-CoA:carnitine CoA-transferase CaiB-like acyl-CoA transferase|nr:CoA transferase [Pseudomonadales bacterium]
MNDEVGEGVGALLHDVRAALPGGLGAGSVRETGTGALPSRYDVTGLAVASVGAACAELAALAGRDEAILVDRALASGWFGFSVRPMGWELPPVWDAIAGVYPTRDGCIRLHTNAPHHRAAALAALGCEADRDAIAAVIAERTGDDVEAAIVAANGCAARLRPAAEWAEHPQGRAVAAEPLIAWEQFGSVYTLAPAIDPARPLAGVRVLDLTRVLAGPVCTRFLAAFGADVLRVDPPGWGEAVLEPEVTIGKRCATLDLRSAEGAATLRALAADADLLVHGYRPGALRGLGLDPETLRAANPGLIDVSLCAWGWTGPWAERRGYDSLVQMSCGLAADGEETSAPDPLPVQALDQGTGYLMAAAAVRALRLRRETGQVTSARTSLARTAVWLAGTLGADTSEAHPEETDQSLTPEIEETVWGRARRLRFPGSVQGIEVRWAGPARPLHGDAPVWA